MVWISYYIPYKTMNGKLRNALILTDLCQEKGAHPISEHASWAPFY